MKIGTACPVCQTPQTEVFLERHHQPVFQNRLMDTQAVAVGIERGDLALRVCGHCGFIFNSAFDPELLRYGADYDNTQDVSPCFEQYLRDIARHLLYERGVRQRRIVEVGCGKGRFLRLLVGDSEMGNRGFGFDPSYVGPLEDLEGRLTFQRRRFDPGQAAAEAEVVVCRHVIEHVPDPVGLISAMRVALTPSPGARLFLETPCAEWILSRRVIWDFFYEHCSYFTAESLSVALARAGLKPVEIRHIFGGQYLWAEAAPATATEPDRPPVPSRMPSLARTFGVMEAEQRDTLARRLDELAQGGATALWGAGAKGVTLANLVDPHRERIACVVDLNPNKQGRYLPGTGHPIVGYMDLPHYGVAAAVVMNPNYYEENRALLERARLNIALVNLAAWDGGRHETGA